MLRSGRGKDNFVIPAELASLADRIGVAQKGQPPLTQEDCDRLAGRVERLYELTHLVCTAKRRMHGDEYDELVSGLRSCPDRIVEIVLDYAETDDVARFRLEAATLIGEEIEEFLLSRRRILEG